MAIASIGECMLELSAEGDGLWRLGFGGDTFNTLWTLRALTDPGRRADYVSAFGDDAFSREQIAFFAQFGIGTGHSPVIAGARPGIYAISLLDGERSFTYWRSEAAARQLARDPAALASSLQGRELVYFSGITLAILDEADRATLIEALATARAHGTRIAFDPNYRARLWPGPATARKAITQALAVCDIVMPTFPDESELFGDDTPQATAQRIERAHVGEIAVKNGEAAALVAHYGDRAEIAPPAVPDLVDTTGAGDAFNGAYLAARLGGETPFDAARRAHRVAAAIIRVRGALAEPQLLKSAYAG